MNTRALVPEDLPRIAATASRSNMQSLTRAVLAVALRHLSRNNSAVEKILAADSNADLLTKAATTPTTLAGATALQHIAYAFVDALQPVSASAALIARSLQLNLDGVAQVSVPGITVPRAAFVGEAAAIPVTAGTSSTYATLTPFKLAVLITLTGEMLRNTNAEALVRAALLANVGPSLDAAMFTTNAGTPGVSPPGILHNITPITPIAGGGMNALAGDITALADALSAVAGNGQIVLIGAVKQATALGLLTPNGPPFPLLVSSALAAGTVVAVATQALATSVGAPQIEASRDTAIQEQTTPTTDLLAQAPVRSVYQTDNVSLRFKLPATWALRGPGVAWITGTTW